MKKLLIIEDEFIFRQGLRYMMDWESAGYTIVGEASNGQEGLDAMRWLCPDLILCDVVMPVMDGVEFVRRSRGLDGPPVIMLSNFDEFDKVRQAFKYGAADYLLKNRVTSASLVQCFHRINAAAAKPAIQADKSFGSLVRHILDGYVVPPYQEFSDFLRSRFSSTSLFLIYIDTPRYDFENEQVMQNALRQALSCLEVYAAFTSLNHGIALIGQRAEGDVWPLPQDGNQPAFSVRELLASVIKKSCCVISTPFSQLNQLKEHTERLAKYAKYSVLFEDRLCFYEQELDVPPVEAPAFPTAVYESCISLGRWDEAHEILQEYLEFFRNCPQANPYKLKKLVEHTFYEALQEARKHASDQALLSRTELKLFKQIDCAVRFCDLLDAIAQAYEGLSCALPSRSGAPVDPVIHVLHSFLEENYAGPITLYDAAAHLHMNYSYLSAYISQNTHKHFSGLLNEIRISHAKRLLRSTDQSISTISASIGYTDQSYFGKIFKKLAGVTPHQYRNAAAGKGNLRGKNKIHIL